MKNIVELAESQVSIVQVCKLIGIDVEDGGRATKYMCPFAEVFHSRPNEKSFRVYTDTNTAFCFASSCGFFSPVSLYAKAEGFVSKDGKLRMREAAKALLVKFGHEEPAGSSWEELTNPKPRPVNTKMLGQALDVYMQRCLLLAPEDTDQNATHIYTQLLTLLPQVKDEAAAEQWLSIGKQAI